MNVGIDFGTTNSSVAYQRSVRSPVECASVDQYSSLPFDVILRTAVLLEADGRIVPTGIGEAARDPGNWKNKKTGQFRRVIERIKPFLATFRLHEQWPVQRTRIDFDSYDHLRQTHRTITFTDLIHSGDSDFSREELLTAGGAVLKRLFDSLPAGVLTQDSQIVMGIPLIFPDYAKKRLMDIVVRSRVLGNGEPYREAVRRIRFLPEPVGASLLFGDECRPASGKTTGKILVFDSGGGTLDLAVLEFSMIEGTYRPTRQLALDASAIAGRRFDEAIENNLLLRHLEAVRRWTGETGDQYPIAKAQIAKAAESIKLNLSTRDEYRELSLIGAGISPSVTRAQFETWALPVLDETERLIRSTVSDLGDIDTVVMVGGSSLIPCVQQRVQSLFSKAAVLCESAADGARGGGVERALTAVSKGLALYDTVVARQGITPFSYGFWDQRNGRVLVAAGKWSTHDAERPVVSMDLPDGQSEATLTLVQELVEQERVLNVLNVPATSRNGKARIQARVRTSDGALYPDIELIEVEGGVTGTLQLGRLPERVLKQLIQRDDHAVRWPSREPRSGSDTPYAEIVKLKKGDAVVFRQRDVNGLPIEIRGRILRIDKIADGLPYDEVGHWDLTRWRFHIKISQTGQTTFWPIQTSDIRLDREPGHALRRRRRGR